MKFRLSLVLLAAVATTLSAQGQEAPNLGDLMQAMGAMMGANSNSAAAVVDFRELKALLPSDLPGMKRKSANGEKNTAMGITLAEAEGRYESDNGTSSITLKISDYGGTGGMASMMQFGWAATEVDKESDTGYERSSVIGGNKALEEYNTERKSGSIKVLVHKHFTVEAEGDNVTPEQLMTAIQKVDTAKLATLQPKAAAPAH